MDPHKVVTGGPDDPLVNVWDANTGTRTNSLICSPQDKLAEGLGCSAMAVDGCRIVTASGDDQENTIVRFRDFRFATCHVSSNLSEASSAVSKFWGPHSDSDSEELDWQ
ncbi:UNVERIFIED_CONTAM: hypothetical protein Sangu_1278500 [Sesamum angustifolium]